MEKVPSPAVIDRRWVAWVQDGFGEADGMLRSYCNTIPTADGELPTESLHLAFGTLTEATSARTTSWDRIRNRVLEEARRL